MRAETILRPQPLCRSGRSCSEGSNSTPLVRSPRKSTSLRQKETAPLASRAAHLVVRKTVVHDLGIPVVAEEPSAVDGCLVLFDEVVADPGAALAEYSAAIRRQPVGDAESIDHRGSLFSRSEGDDASGAIAVDGRDARTELASNQDFFSQEVDILPVDTGSNDDGIAAGRRGIDRSLDRRVMIRNKDRSGVETRRGH